MGDSDLVMDGHSNDYNTVRGHIFTIFQEYIIYNGDM